jgi:2-C-methyl-D-erythritol 4-phosphate cytidylyltransferase
MKTVALIVAAGKGIRFGGGVPKQFRNLNNRPLLSWTIEQFEKASSINEIFLVVAEEYLLYAGEKIIKPYSYKKLTRIVKGGANRRESVKNGLNSLPLSTGFVAVHDGARPVIHYEDINRVVATAQIEKAAILARPVSDTIKRAEAEFVISTVDRSKLYRAETPQVFQYDLLKSAHENYSAEGETEITDDASLVEALGFKVKMVISEQPNIKVTTEMDLKIAETILEQYS